MLELSHCVQHRFAGLRVRGLGLGLAYALNSKPMKCSLAILWHSRLLYASMSGCCTDLVRV